MNVAMEKTAVGPGMSRQPYGAPTSSHKSIESMAAPSGTAANNLSPELSPGKDGGEPRAMRRTLAAISALEIVVRRKKRRFYVAC